MSSDRMSVLGQRHYKQITVNSEPQSRPINQIHGHIASGSVSISATIEGKSKLLKEKSKK